MSRLADDRLNPAAAFKLSGACVAAMIGSGFSSGQELLQFFTVYGFHAAAGIIISFLITVLILRELFHSGLSGGSGSYFRQIFGRRAGGILDGLCILYVFGVFIVMLSGAGAALNQYMGLSTGMGAALMAAACVLSVLMGLKKLVDLIGAIGPLLIITTIAIGLASLFSNFDGLSSVRDLLPELNAKKAGTGWFSAAILYPCFNTLGLIPVVTSFGALAKNKRTASSSALLSSAAYHAAILVLVFAMLANLGAISGKLSPNMALAGLLHPVAEFAFIIMILLAIYSSACPLLWSIGAGLCKNEKGTAYRALIIAVTASALIASEFFSLDVLINRIYGLSGYAGILLVCAVVLKRAAARLKKPKFLVVSLARRHGAR